VVEVVEVAEVAEVVEVVEVVEVRPKSFFRRQFHIFDTCRLARTQFLTTVSHF